MNKKGWIRILEATIAVLIVSGVLITVYTRQPDRSLDAGEYVYSVQREILDTIATSSEYRQDVLTYTSGDIPQDLQDLVDAKLISTFQGRIRICPLTEPVTPCKMEEADVKASQGKDVFIEEIIISTDFVVSTFQPKKVKLFVWENR